MSDLESQLQLHKTGLFCLPVSFSARVPETLNLTCTKYNFRGFQFQFEERVADLEAQLRLFKRQGDGDIKPYEHPHTHAIALERELDSTRERYKKQITELTTQVDKLTGELTKLRKQLDSEYRRKKNLKKKLTANALQKKKKRSKQVKG